jgi:glutathione S-transferase
MKLYYHPLSPNSQKVVLALYEKGVAFEGEVVDILDPAAVGAYRKNVNPLGKVPFLVADDGERIPESTIIVEYLDATFPEPRLFPVSGPEARRARHIERIADLWVIQKLGVVFFDARRPPEKRDPAAVDTARQLLERGLTHLEGLVGTRTFAAGDALTVADLTLSAGLAFAQAARIPLGPHPNLQTWFDGISRRPSWQRVRHDAEPYLKGLARA